MKLYVNPGIRKLKRIVDKEFDRDFTVMHYTGNMLGIGCASSSNIAIARISKLKMRNDAAGFILLIPDRKWFDDQHIWVPDELRRLMQQYYPGNLTIIFDIGKSHLDRFAVDRKIAFRVPVDPMLRVFLDMIGEPLISTSINYTGLPPVTEVEKAQQFFSSWFDIAILPELRSISPEAQPSTIVEYQSPGDQGNVPSALKCVREGSVPFYEVSQSFTSPKVTFVCTANICRSPIAEHLFKFYAKRHGMAFGGDSCGLIEGGGTISFNSLRLLVERGVEGAEGHVSKQIDMALVNRSWLILTMEERQRDFLRQAFPLAEHKISTLNETVGEKGDVSDPYGSGLDYYSSIYDQIDDRIKRLITLIKEDGIDF